MAAAAGPSLDALAKAKGLRFGSAIGAGPPGSLTGPFNDPRYRELMIAECGVMVPENELKWYVLRPDAKRFDFQRADLLAKFAAEHGMGLRGHTLLWHKTEWFPAWVAKYDFGPRPGTEVERMLVEHIRTVCARYPQVYSWDVVNETVDPDTGALRETPFSRHAGQKVLDIAFHTAREAAPHAQLVYNDYMSWEAGNEKHRAGVLRLLERFRKDNVPVDALGVQSHIGSGNTDNSVGFNTAQEKPWRAFLNEVIGMGYDLTLTEFDVHDKNLPFDVARRDRAVADLGRAYLDLMFSYDQTKELLCWGLSDRYSWLQGLWLRADKKPKRPTPYDADFKPKPLRTAIADALRAAPARRPRQ
jgi:endo-1,4-beta-xylanase